MQALGLEQRILHGGLLQEPCLHAPEGLEEVISLSSCGGSKSSKRNESSESFFHLCACARISTEARHPQAENRLLRSSSSMRCLARSRSLSMISLRPPTRRRRCLFLRSSSIRHRVSPRSSQSSCAMRCRWCERSASSARPRGAACVACRREAAGPSEQPRGRERPRPPTRRASPGAMPARTGRPLRKSSL